MTAAITYVVAQSHALSMPAGTEQRKKDMSWGYRRIMSCSWQMALVLESVVWERTVWELGSSINLGAVGASSLADDARPDSLLLAVDLNGSGSLFPRQLRNCEVTLLTDAVSAVSAAKLSLRRLVLLTTSGCSSVESWTGTSSHRRLYSCLLRSSPPAPLDLCSLELNSISREPAPPLIPNTFGHDGNNHGRARERIYAKVRTLLWDGKSSWTRNRNDADDSPGWHCFRSTSRTTMMFRFLALTTAC